MQNNRYIIMKTSRSPLSGVATEQDAYRGITCEWANTEPGKVYTDYIEARIDADKMGDMNPVQFRVWKIGERATP